MRDNLRCSFLNFLPWAFRCLGLPDFQPSEIATISCTPIPFGFRGIGWITSSHMKGDKITARAVLRDRDPFGDAPWDTGPLEFERPKFRQFKKRACAVHPRDLSLIDLVAGALGMGALLETRILGPPGKEVLKGRILVSKLLRKDRGARLFQPGVSPKLFEKGQFPAKVDCADVLAVNPVFPIAPGKAEVPHPAGAAKLNSQCFRCALWG